jgi:hypothetical protein
MAERADEGLRAGELYEKLFREKGLKSGGTGEPMKIALQAGRLYLKAGEPGRAVEVFTFAGLFAEAAEAHLSCGEKAKAAEAFVRAKDFSRAAGLFQEIGEEKRGRCLLAEHLKQEGKHLQAAGSRGDV